MKLFQTREKKIITLSIVLGLLLCAYLLRDKYGRLGKIEIISIGIAAVIAVSIALIMAKIGNKKL